MTSHSKTMLCSEINDKSFTTEFTITMVEIRPFWMSQGFLLEKLKCGDKNLMLQKPFILKFLFGIYNFQLLLD